MFIFWKCIYFKFFVAEITTEIYPDFVDNFVPWYFCSSHHVSRVGSVLRRWSSAPSFFQSRRSQSRDRVLFHAAHHQKRALHADSWDPQQCFRGAQAASRAGVDQTADGHHAGPHHRDMLRRREEERTDVRGLGGRTWHRPQGDSGDEPRRSGSDDC